MRVGKSHTLIFLRMQTFNWHLRALVITLTKTNTQNLSNETRL